MKFSTSAPVVVPGPSRLFPLSHFVAHLRRAIDMADEFPRAEVIAVDLAPIQPRFVALPKIPLLSFFIFIYPVRFPQIARKPRVSSCLSLSYPT